MSKNLFVLCMENKDCEDLEKRKIYQVISDPKSENEGYLRIIDESGEDYLYPKSYFVLVQLPQEAEKNNANCLLILLTGVTSKREVIP